MTKKNTCTNIADQNSSQDKILMGSSDVNDIMGTSASSQPSSTSRENDVIGTELQGNSDDWERTVNQQGFPNIEFAMGYSQEIIDQDGGINEEVIFNNDFLLRSIGGINGQERGLSREFPFDKEDMLRNSRDRNVHEGGVSQEALLDNEVVDPPQNQGEHFPEQSKEIESESLVDLMLPPNNSAYLEQLVGFHHSKKDIDDDFGALENFFNNNDSASIPTQGQRQDESVPSSTPVVTNESAEVEEINQEIEEDEIQPVVSNQESVLTSVVQKTRKRKVNTRAKCRICRTELYDKKWAEIHEKTVHAGTKNRCTACPEELGNVYFRTEAGLYKHIMKMHAKGPKSDLEKLDFRTGDKRQRTEPPKILISTTTRMRLERIAVNGPVQPLANEDEIQPNISAQALPAIAAVTENHEKPILKCRICRAKISTKHTLAQHENTIHIGTKNMCAYCPKELGNVYFTTETGLYRHIMKSHATGTLPELDGGPNTASLQVQTEEPVSATEGTREDIQPMVMHQFLEEVVYTRTDTPPVEIQTEGLVSAPTKTINEDQTQPVFRK